MPLPSEDTPSYIVYRPSSIVLPFIVLPGYIWCLPGCLVTIHPGYFCDTARFLPGISGFLSPMSLLTGLFLRDRSIFALESPGFSNQRPKTHKPPLPHCNQFFLSVTTYPHSRTQDGATIKAKPRISCLLCQSIPKKLISQLVQSTLTATALPTIYDHDPGSLFRVLSQQPKHAKKNNLHLGHLENFAWGILYPTQQPTPEPTPESASICTPEPTPEPMPHTPENSWMLLFYKVVTNSKVNLTSES